MPKLVTFKVPDDVLERIDADAKALNISRTALLLKPWTPEAVYTNTPRYIRPTHSLDCKCLMCKPLK